MSAPQPLPSRLGQLRWLWLAIIVVAVDQASKAMVVSNLQLFERRDWLPMLGVTHVHNLGAAFSFLNDAGGWQRYLFLGLAIVVSAVIVVWLARLKGRVSWMLPAGLAMIAGGAIGNAVDRVTRGFVVDFIDVHWFEVYHFYAFNLADTAITIGAGLLILDTMLEANRPGGTAAS